MRKKITQEEFIAKTKSIHGDKYDYSKVVFKNLTTKVEIICRKHGSFLQRPSDHLRGKGCAECSGKKKMDKKSFIEKARKIHGDKYDYSKVEYKGNKVKVCIVCHEHGEFWQRPNDHLSGHGCDICCFNNRKSLICGWGINDMVNQRHTKAYRIWEHIIYRCKSNKRSKNIKSYEDCYISEEWKYFSCFKKWFDSNYIDGWNIDKDLFSDGKKIYSPETCCFLPKELNSIIKNGVIINEMSCIQKKKDKFFVRLRSNGGFSSKWFDNKEDAIMFYRKEKTKTVILIADKYRDKIPIKTYEALKNFFLRKLYF